MGFPKSPRLRPPSPDFDAARAATTAASEARIKSLLAKTSGGPSADFEGPFSDSLKKRIQQSLPLDEAAADGRANFERVYQAAKDAGVEVPANDLVASATPNYVIPDSLGRVRYAGGGGLTATINKSTPMQMSEAVNGPEIAAINREFFLRNNSRDQQAPFPIVNRRSLENHLDGPRYLLRGLSDDFEIPGAYGIARPAEGTAVWYAGLEGHRTTPYHEAIGHLGNDSPSISFYRDMIAGGGLGLMENIGDLKRALKRQNKIGKDLYFEGMDEGIDDGELWNLDEERLNLWDRMANDPGAFETKALMAEALSDMQGIHGPARTNADRTELFRMLIGERPLPYLSEPPEYQHGPRAGDPATNFVPLQQGIHTLYKSLPAKEQKKNMRELWLKLFSDNSENPEAQYA